MTVKVCGSVENSISCKVNWSALIFSFDAKIDTTRVPGSGRCFLSSKENVLPLMFKVPSIE